MRRGTHVRVLVLSPGDGRHPDASYQRIALLRNPHVVGAARTPSRALASRAKHAPATGGVDAWIRGKAITRPRRAARMLAVGSNRPAVAAEAAEL
jgi:hypothetical protein